MHVGGSGPGTPAYPLDPRAKAYPPDSAADAPVCSREMGAPDPGPESRATEKGGAEQRPPAVRKDERRRLL